MEAVARKINRVLSMEPSRVHSQWKSNAKKDDPPALLEEHMGKMPNGWKT